MAFQIGKSKSNESVKEQTHHQICNLAAHSIFNSENYFNSKSYTKDYNPVKKMIRAYVIIETEDNEINQKSYSLAQESSKNLLPKKGHIRLRKYKLTSGTRDIPKRESCQLF